MKKSIKLSTFAAILSLVNLILFNIPFLIYAAKNVDPGFGGTLIVIGLAVLVFTLNFFAAYLILRPLRMVGKVIIAIIHFLSTIAVYFVIVYKTIMDESMMGNVFNTQYSEASGFINFKLIVVAAIVGLIPAILIARQKIEYGSWKRYGICCGSSLGVSLIIILLNAGNVLWFGTHDTELGGLTMPWSYTANTYLHFHIKNSENKQEILLPDASIADSTKTCNRVGHW